MPSTVIDTPLRLVRPLLSRTVALPVSDNELPDARPVRLDKSISLPTPEAAILNEAPVTVVKAWRLSVSPLPSLASKVMLPDGSVSVIEVSPAG